MHGNATVHVYQLFTSSLLPLPSVKWSCICYTDWEHFVSNQMVKFKPLSWSLWYTPSVLPALLLAEPLLRAFPSGAWIVPREKDLLFSTRIFLLTARQRQGRAPLDVGTRALIVDWSQGVPVMPTFFKEHDGGKKQTPLIGQIGYGELADWSHRLPLVGCLFWT